MTQIASRLLMTHLAQFSVFSQQGEVLCTRGLEHLLQSAEAQIEFAKLLQSRTSNYCVSESLTWRAEVLQRDGGRPDLEATDTDANPKIKVEAKLGAALHESQLQSYAADLRERNGGGLVVVLVPHWRVNGVKDVALRACENQQLLCESVVVSWESVLSALTAVRSDPLASDIAQFRAMYLSLTSSLIVPISDDDLATGWRNDPPKFIRLVDVATRQLSAPGSVLPIGVEDENGPELYHRRYVCRKLGEKLSCFSVGVRDPFQNHSTPLWLRFHRDTHKFAVIQERLAATPLWAKTVGSGGHLWVPIEVPVDAPPDGTVQGIVDQAERIALIAFRPLK